MIFCSVREIWSVHPVLVTKGGNIANNWEVQVHYSLSSNFYWGYLLQSLPGGRFRYGPLARYVELQFAHAPGMPGTFSPPLRFSDPDMHHGTCVTHVPWCMSGSLTSGFLWSRWWGKRSRHSRRMRNPQFYVSGKKSIVPVKRGEKHIRLVANNQVKHICCGLGGNWQNPSNCDCVDIL